MAEIQIAIKNKIPEVVGDVKCIVSDNSDYWVRFSFDDQWDDGEKTAYFVLDDGYAYPPATITDDVVSVPRQHSGGIGKRIYIGVSQGNTRTSQGIGLCVFSSITDMIDDSAVQPEPTMWEDVIARLDELEKNGGGGGGIAAETDPTVPEWAKQPKKPIYTASEVGADPAGAASGAVSVHNTSDAAHNDIRLLITGLTNRLNALANSTDEDLDQLAEIVAYIKANKSLIDSVTTNKVSVTDIIDNLTTGDSKKPLSAAQGKALKALYDAIPAWAKESNKPSYSKSDVGLGNVDNVKQYSASNPPPYPVKTVNGKTGAVQLSASDVGAVTTEQLDRLSAAIEAKLDANKLPEAINTALAQAKASGEFDGEDGSDYVLTDADKTEIAGIAAGMVDTALLNIIGSGVTE